MLVNGSGKRLDASTCICLSGQGPSPEGLEEEETESKKQWRRLVSAIERSEQNTGTGQGHPISTHAVTLYGYNEAFDPFGPTGPSTGHPAINS